MNSPLLPNGLVDLMPEEAEKEAAAIETLMGVFASLGHRRVKPPLIEFEDTLLSGTGEGLTRQTFRLMDPLSQKMMGVRADITPQIVRLVNGRFHQEDRPLRLAYAGDVLRVNGTQLRPDRQFCQVGCELVGTDHIEADIESIVLAIMGLKALHVPEISVDITLPALVRNLIDVEAHADLVQALDQKDRGKVRELGGKFGEMFVELLKASGRAEEALPKLKAAKTRVIAGDLQRLIDVTQGVMAACKDLGFDDVIITVDPVERSTQTYHNGIGYALYSGKARGVLGRGGRYSFAGERGTTDTAIGFTLYMDTIRRVLPIPFTDTATDIPAKTSWAEIGRMQGQGQKVKRKF